MDIVNQSNPEVIAFLGGNQQKKKNVKYRFNKYCVFTPLDELHTLIYNSLTGGLVCIREMELNNVFTEYLCDYQDYLIWNYFLVREDFDEDLLVDTYRKQKKVYSKGNYLQNPSKFVIMTTSACNAKCTYCYELPLKGKKHMSDEVVDKVIKYILENGSIFEPLTLSFFGGEPLYNYMIISKIITNVISTGKKINVDMISNGYLFNESMIKRAKEEWNLQEVQITLDGVDEKYNQIKRYIYKDDPNPFRTVISNIHNLINNGIRVVIRMNCGINNYEDIKELIEFLGEEFKGASNISAYVWEIFQDITPENSKVLYNNLNRLLKLLKETGLLINSQVQFGIKAQHCMVDSGNTLFITPEGNIGLCEHYIDKKIIGNLDNPEIKDESVINSWFNYIDTHTELCLSCPIRPACLKIHDCTDENLCDKYAQEFELEKVKTNMLLTYENFLKNQNNNCNNQCCNQN